MTTKSVDARAMLAPGTSITLIGTSNGMPFERTFQIHRPLARQNEEGGNVEVTESSSEGVGGSVVCYKAKHSDSSIGILKEFYPYNAFYLQRKQDGQLLLSREEPQEHEAFRAMKERYLRPLQTLLEITQSGYDDDLATFIPRFELYYSATQADEEGTIYIWTPDPELQTFDKICEEIHKAPQDRPERQLATVLSAIYSLTSCVKLLHDKGLVHRDINPRNFGFVQRGGKTLTQAISIFDVNTITSIYENDGMIYTTEGYTEPEAEQAGSLRHRRYEADFQTDIYAIGATLFHAIVVNDEMKEGEYRYRKEYHSRLQELVERSELILATEKSFHPELRQVLTKILKNSLAPRRSGKRYEDCADLLQDLEDAVFYTFPATVDSNRLSVKKWVLQNLKRRTGKNAGSALPFQYHLFRHPLYRCTQGEDMNVLLLGFGSDGQKFMDTTLQNGQMEGKNLHVTVVSQSVEYKAGYLLDRAELENFFDIDRPYSGPETSYGSITFLQQTFSLEERTEDSVKLSKFLKELCKTCAPHYVFIALGEDGRNRLAARECREYFRKAHIRCDISYLCEESTGEDVGEEYLHPLSLAKSNKTAAFHKEIRRMAFNTHLLWKPDLRVDYEGIRAEFKDPYNYTASVASVLAIKYKLYSLGIDLREGKAADLREAARLFTEKKRGADWEALLNKLMWLEHRRWVTEKACQGWRVWSSDQEIEAAARTGRQKDERRKYHICMVHSLPNRNLETCFGTDYHTWDNPTQEQLDMLDELDLVAVKWHQAFNRLAGAINEQTLTEELDGIRRLVEQDAAALIAYQEWYLCLIDIYQRDAGRDRLEMGLREAFLNRLTDLPDEVRNTVRKRVELFSELFQPFRGRMELKDWKRNDIDLIEGIPFILTYSSDLRLAIPFVMGSHSKALQNDQVFQNVAAAVVSNPEEICYLCEVRNRDNLDALMETLSHVTNFMNKQALRARVRLLLAYGPELEGYADDQKSRERLAETLREKGNGRIDKDGVDCFFAADEDSTTTQLIAGLVRYKKTAFLLELNSTSLCVKLMGAGVKKKFDMYWFDAPECKAYAVKGCDAISYINKKPCITVADMISLQQAASTSSNQPILFEHYQELWKKYRNRTDSWKILCNALAEHCRKADLIGYVQRKSESVDAERRKTEIFISKDCMAGADKIVRFLKENGFLEEESGVSGGFVRGTVTLLHRSNHEEVYRRLFSDEALSNPSNLNLQYDNVHKKAMVFSSRLSVDHFVFPKDYLTGQKEILNTMRGNRYLNNLQIDEVSSTASFRFADQQFKDLLTNAGRILEIYVYHRLKELGEFDNVVSGHEIKWKLDAGVTNELDCIVTKGFRSLFIECKATASLDENYYFKLFSLTKQFGIHAIPVIIADTQEETNKKALAVHNENQRERGDMMGVRTIWKKDDIDHIDEILLALLMGKENPAPNKQK